MWTLRYFLTFCKGGQNPMVFRRSGGVKREDRGHESGSGVKSHPDSRESTVMCHELEMAVGDSGRLARDSEF
jgi:hypothetical protein